MFNLLIIIAEKPNQCLFFLVLLLFQPVCGILVLMYLYLFMVVFQLYCRGPGMNRCDISEEETTKALNALYQLPSSESLTNPQTHANRTSYIVPSGHAQHLDPNYQNLNSNGMSNRGKKKHGVKETLITGSGNGLLNSYLQEPVKCTSLNDMNQPTLVSNPMKKSSGQLMIKLQNLGMEEKQKEKQMIGGM